MTDDEIFRFAADLQRSMNRRRFLRASGVTAGAFSLAPFLAACGSDDDSGSGSDTTAAGGEEADPDRKDKGSASRAPPTSTRPTGRSTSTTRRSRRSRRPAASR